MMAAGYKVRNNRRDVSRRAVLKVTAGDAGGGILKITGRKKELMLPMERRSRRHSRKCEAHH